MKTSIIERALEIAVKEYLKLKYSGEITDIQIIKVCGTFIKRASDMKFYEFKQKRKEILEDL